MRYFTVTSFYKMKELLSMGNKVIDVQYKNNRVVFVFERTEKIISDLQKIKK